MDSIKTNSYIDIIEKLLLKHGLSIGSLMVVDDVDRWCVTQGIMTEKEYYPFRIAKCLYSSEENKYLILIAENISDGMISSANGLVRMRLGNSYADKLRDHELFVRHTVLHEIGHTQGLSEEGCDVFAYDQITQYIET